MSDDEGMRISRRSVLAGTAALGLAGSSTAVAGQFDGGAVADADDEFEASVDSAAWPMARQDSGQTNYNSNPNPPTDALRSEWEFRPTERGVREPLVADGMAYVLRNINRLSDEPQTQTLYGVDAADGTERWRVELERGDNRHEFNSRNLAVADGRVYVSWYDDESGKTLALDAETGDEQWSIGLGNGEPLLVGDSLVFEDATAEGQGFASVSRADGSVNWRQDFEKALNSEVASAGGSVFVSIDYEEKDGSALYSLSAETGETRWSEEFEDGTWGQLVATDQSVYFSDFETVFAFEHDTGDRRWKRRRQHEDGVSDLEINAVDDDNVYALFEDYQYAFDAETGTEQWSFKWDGSQWSDFVVSGDVLYYTEFTPREEKDVLWMRDAETGAPVASQRVETETTNSSVLVPVGETLYSNIDGSVVALREDADGSSDDEAENDNSGDDERSDGGGGGGSEGSGDSGDGSSSADGDSGGNC